jgi:demethylmenaquinone methyltransferase / 2-methoxy-6-polyprenyl-1,4-benzoquinol methylase
MLELEMIRNGASPIGAIGPERASGGAAAGLAPHPVLPQFYAEPEQRASVVNSLFDDTARHYDRITWLMSLGTGAAYRRDALRRIGVRQGSSVLDVACGTGQVSAAALQLVGPAGVVVGVDPSDGMRHVAQTRRNICTLQGAAERLPVEDRSFDVVVMGYALRHVSDLITAFREMRRVLRPGGTVGILEITPPQGAIPRALLKLYLKRVVPPAALLATASWRARELMSYYWESIEQCVKPSAIMAAMETAGLQNPTRSRTLGIFNEYVSTAPTSAAS